MPITATVSKTAQSLFHVQTLKTKSEEFSTTKLFLCNNKLTNLSRWVQPEKNFDLGKYYLNRFTNFNTCLIGDTINFLPL